MWYAPSPNQPGVSRPFPGTPTTLAPEPVVESLLEDSVPGFPYQRASAFVSPTVGVNRVYNTHTPNNGAVPYGLPAPGPLGRVSYAPPPPMPLVRPYRPEFENQFSVNRAVQGFGESEASTPAPIKTTGQPCSPATPCPSDQTCRWGKCRPMAGAEVLPWGWIGLFAGAAVVGFLWKLRK